MSYNELYWVALQAVIGTASQKVFEIINKNINIKDVFSDNNERRLCGVFNEKELGGFDEGLRSARIILERCKRLGYGIITPEHPLYPNRIRNIFAPPAVLYVQGVMPEFDNEVAVAMVGTRGATDYGRAVAVDLAMSLASAGALIVSGAAKGIDAYSHTGALQVFGRTAAVLGCSIDNRYLMENQPLRDMIAKKGAVITEYPPTTPARPWHFPERNRLISGLSLGTVIIEAGEKSGSLITANYALEQGRELFAVPGSIMHPSFAGTNRLLREGAKPVFVAMDVLEEYKNRFPHKLDLSKAEKTIGTSFVNSATVFTSGAGLNKKAPGNNRGGVIKGAEKKIVVRDIEGLSSDAGLVYNSFSRPQMSMDELVETCGLPPPKLMRALTELEMAGYITAVSGNRYAKI